MRTRNLQSMAAMVFIYLALFQCKSTPKQFTELNPTEIGIDFQNNIVENQYHNILTYEYTYNGGGVAAGDINNDGLVDLYFSGNSVLNKMYLNLGGLKFKDISTNTRLTGREDWKTGVTMVDINGDGWLDIYVCYSGNAPDEGYNRPVIKQYPNRSNQLFVNSGCKPGELPTFTDRAKEYGLDAIGTFSTQAYFLDYDQDGDLDMFLLNHANMFYAAFFNTNRLRNLRHPYFGNKLFRNDNNKFVEVSKESGIHGSGLNFGLSASISDLNFDGYPDIYVTNDFEEQDFCYLNNQDGTFSERSHVMFGHLSKFSMGSDIADINNDGLQDILVVDMLPEDNYRQKLLRGPDEYDKYHLAVDSGYHHQYMRNTLQLNRGFAKDSLPRFSEIGQLAGISNTDWSWSALLTDFDNDGLKDVFISNGFLRDFTNLDFMKYTGDIYNEAREKNTEVDYVKIIQQLPQTKLINYVFQNKDGIKFVNQSEAWGFSRKAITNGAVYADLDNDGDQDIIANCLNDYPLVYRNNNESMSDNRYIKIRLKGMGNNTFGLGSKIWIKAEGKTIFQEAYYSRGYQSSTEPVIMVGVGAVPRLEEVKVQWSDGTYSILNNVATNQQIIVEQKNTTDMNFPPLNLPNPSFMVNVTESSGIDFIHQEDDYVDFKSNRLLLYQLSRLGGKLSCGDLNGDGNEDVYIGGASGQTGALFFGQDDGGFKKSSQVWPGDAMKEDMGSLFFDADNDHDLDLYVVSGGIGLVQDSLYQDRLYINDGNGNFARSIKSLPVEHTSGSCVRAGDFDQDGDQDLFVGGRHTDSLYPYIPRSYILRNDTQNGKIKFVDVTTQVNPALENPGMVTDAIWSDYNSDGWQDLILVGEWMPIKIFINEKGKMVSCSECESALANSNGWWNCIYTTDIDEDGDPDYFLGNAGENLQFKASRSEPVELFADDFNSDGRLDPILTYHIQGKSYPMPSRDEMLEQINPLRKKFIKYEDYARATLEDVIPKSQLEKSNKYMAFTLKSVWMENLIGQSLRLHDLPAISQFSSVQCFVHSDVNHDGKNELIGMGNFFPYRVQLGKSDAGMGFVLHYKNGEVVSDQNMKTPTWLDGDIRDGVIVKFKSGIKRLVISRNNGPVEVYELKSQPNVDMN